MVLYDSYFESYSTREKAGIYSRGLKSNMVTLLVVPANAHLAHIQTVSHNQIAQKLVNPSEAA